MNEIKSLPKAIAQTMPAPLTKTQSSLAESASKNFWIFRNHVGKKLCTCTLPVDVQKQITKKLIEVSKTGHKPQSGVRTLIDLFGPKQQEFKDLVIAKGAAIHTHSEAKTMSYKDKCPERIIYVMNSMEFETESDELIQRRKEGVLEFVKDYDAYCEIGRRACDNNFPFEVVHNGTLMRVSELLTYPSKQEFIDGFYAYRSEMLPLANFDKEKFAHLPAEYVNRKAAEVDAAVVRDMDRVKGQALESVRISMDLLATQLSKSNGRLHESLVAKAKQAAAHLSEIADGYNNSQMLRGLAKTIEDRILVHTASWESFKENPQAKSQAARAAASVSKKLGQIGKPKTAKVATKAAVKSVSKGKSAAGGLMARKKRKAAAKEVQAK